MDADHATRALESLDQIAVESHDEAVQAAHAEAIRAVDELLARLAEEPQARDEETPDDWDDDEWDEAIEQAVEKAEIAVGTGTITTKTIDEREYYYLQWREGERVKSQYVGPVEPA